MLIIFFDYEGVVRHEFVPQDQTVNKEIYLEVIRLLPESIRKKRPESWKAKRWMLHHENALAHLSLLVWDFLTRTDTTVIPQPPYSPDLVPADFFLFPKLKSKIEDLTP
jgi:hypothetical protein